jgi:hypothetical protein
VEWIKDKTIDWTIGLVAYSVAVVVIMLAGLANLGSLLFQRLLLYWRD